MRSKKKNFIEKNINFLLNILIVLFGIVLLISLYTGIQTKILGNKYADFFGYSIFEVQTGSMSDAINAGDWAIVKLTKKVKLNDVVTYELNGEYITHRIIEVYKGTYITKGDANSAKDEPVDQNQIVGKVVSVLANLGVIRKTLFNPSVFVALIITLFLFYILFGENFKVKTGKLNKGKNNSMVLDVIAEKVGMVFDAVVKKTDLLFNLICDKSALFFEKVKESKDNIKSKKVVKNNKQIRKHNDVSKIERKVSEHSKKSYNSDKAETDKYSEDELEKTSLYRVVSVDADEVGDKFKGSAKKVESVKYSEDDLEKTSLYRVVSVDADEVDDKFKGLVRKIETDEYKKVVTDKYSEDELEKTSLYRVVSVDADEVDDKFKDPVLEDGTSDLKEEDLDNTSLYRVISVDASEIDDTFLEIAKNEIKVAEKGAKNKDKIINLKPKQEAKKEDKEDKGLTKISLDILKNKKEKSDNIIDTVMLIKEEELNEIIDTLVKNDKTYIKKPTIKDKFISSYINARYYNHYSDKDNESYGKTSISRIRKTIKEVASELINNYRGKDAKYSNIVDKYTDIFILIANLEQAKDSITDSKAKYEFYEKEIIKYSNDWEDKKVEYVIDKIMKIQKNYIGILEAFLKKLETNMFELNFNKLSTRKDMYGLELQHNIAFSKVYSDYIIDKTYSEGIITEDKMSVLLTLLSVQLIKDMISSNFNRKYIFYIPESLYSKEKKFKKLLRMFDDEYAKDNVIILITFEELLRNKQIVKRVRKLGYKFALVFDKEIVIEEKNRSYVYIADYIFVKKEINDMLTIFSFIPEELSDKVIYEDIADKVGDFGGE